jgi:hypothetical protein
MTATQAGLTITYRQESSAELALDVYRPEADNPTVPS